MVVSIPPSEIWETSDDGKWSSFAVQIGTPPQTVRLLPSTSGSAVWAVLDGACGGSGGDENQDCSSKRGDLFNMSASSTFSQVGTKFALPFTSEGPGTLGYSGASEVGSDTITFGSPSDHGVALENQLIVGYGTPTEFLGEIGLVSTSNNVTGLSEKSPLGALRDNGQISGFSWGYTAGSHYRTPPLFGSLTLGGFDAARGNVHNVLDVPLNKDTSRQLLVWIQGIQISNYEISAPSISPPIQAMIDSSVSEIWLPAEACEAFEGAFNLRWEDSSQRYLVNESVHADLLEKNPTVTFSLGSSSGDKREKTDISLPYASFDMNATYPIVGSNWTTSERYFPLLRATNTSQYFLGRTFLQETYLVVDYDRSTLSISPATYPDETTETDVRAINSPSQNSQSKTGSRSIGKGAIGGIAVVAAIVFCLLLAGASFWLFRRRKARRESELPSFHSPPEMTTMEESESSQTADHGFPDGSKPELDAVDNETRTPELESAGVSLGPGKAGFARDYFGSFAGHPSKSSQAEPWQAELSAGHSSRAELPDKQY